MQIRNWERRQSYRKDRGAPPWIKVYIGLLTDDKWAQLSDAEKGQLVTIWMLGASRGGNVSEAEIIKKTGGLDNAPDLKKFKRIGFLEDREKPDDNQMTTRCQPPVNQMTTTCPRNDTPETETETETETEGDFRARTREEDAKTPKLQRPKKPAEPKKQAYGESGSVKLTEEEHRRLVEKDGAKDAAEKIEILDAYLGSRKIDKYRSHYAVLKQGGWVDQRHAEIKITRARLETASGKNNSTDRAPVASTKTGVTWL